MRSFSILKTNVGLTTNIKITVDSNYNLYLDSIDSNNELSNSVFKKVQFNSKNYYDELIPYFYKNIDSNIAFYVKDDNDNHVMYKTFDKQIDDIYLMGCTNITENKYYSEDFEYFAPLYVSKTGLPKYFAIFRVDGPGIIDLNKDNFKAEIINKLKSVKIFELNKNTEIGNWLYNNITNNKSMPINAFEIDFRGGELSYWNGIDYKNGCYTQAASFFEDILEKENTYNDFEKIVYDGFKNNKIVYPHIYNLSFLFDDTPATHNSLREWCINRYSGFYLDDMELCKSISTYIPSVLTSDAIILEGNILYNSSNKPFNELTLGLPYIFVEYLGNFYEVKKIYKLISGVETLQWQILSDINLQGQENLINKNIISIDNNNKISNIDGTTFSINNWNSADVWLLKINDKFHNIQYDSGNYYIYSDYGFKIDSNKLTYYINDPDPNYSTTINVYEEGQTPKSFNIYKCKFTDIKSIDTDVIETEFSKFEYDKSNEIIQTDETKMFHKNLLSNSFPHKEVEHVIKDNIVNIPMSSHYTSNSETFRLLKDPITGSASVLNNLWKKNHQFVKWGYKNSLSSNDYPYLLNNSFSAEDFNRTTDPYSSETHRFHRNLDYFYTINSSTSSYLTNTLHVENIINNNIDTSFSFDLSEYINNEYDYFSYFFDRKSYLNNSSIVKNVSKYSYFNSGDNSLPNITSFRGLKFLLYDVDSVKVSDSTIQNINIKTNNNYDDYKFNILLTKNNITLEEADISANLLTITYSNNNLNWSIIDYWKPDKYYTTQSIVNYYDILYTSVATSSIANPNINPATSSDWAYFTQSNLFWIPSNVYATYSGEISNVVYNSNEYYYNNGYSYTSSFYNPSITYNNGEIVLFNNKAWISTTQSSLPPNTRNIWRIGATAYSYWNETGMIDESGNKQTQWSIVELWDSENIYLLNDLVVYNQILYKATTTTNGIEPTSTTDWVRFYSFVPDTNYIYGTTPSSNNIIYNNNKYYLCKGNTSSSTLDNGITIFINDKYKNVMVNIYYNDNTLTELSNTERDYLYKELYSNLTAFNFSNAINDITNNYGFTNKVKYVILGTSSNSVYDFDKESSYINLPKLLVVNGPDQFLVRRASLDKKPFTLNKSQFNAKKYLNNNELSNADEINHYNGLHLSTIIDTVKHTDSILPNYSGIDNKIYNLMYRLSGPYDPIFTDIQLFQKGATISGNYIFDTELTNFGKVNLLASKINRKGSVLKFRNSPNIKSIFPMIDEFGLFNNDFFIFKSNWDKSYFKECIENVDSSQNETISIAPNRLIIYNPISITPNNLM